MNGVDYFPIPPTFPTQSPNSTGARGPKREEGKTLISDRHSQSLIIDRQEQLHSTLSSPTFNASVSASVSLDF